MKENNFSSLTEAITSWESDEWTKIRELKLDAAVCYSPNENYFIVTHKICVDYRTKRSQIVHILHKSDITPEYIRKIIIPESQIFQE